MKKITLLLVFISTSAIAQQARNYKTNPLPPATNNSEVIGTLTRVGNNKSNTIQTFTSITNFFIGLGSNCSDVSLKSEDFAEAPDEIQNCGEVISSSGDGCYEPQVLQTGFSISASLFVGDDGTEDFNTVSIGKDIILNTIPLVGSFNFENFTIVTFDAAPTLPHAVGFELFTNEAPRALIRVFNKDNKLLGTLMAESEINSETFFGFFADEAIGKIEIEGENESGELIGNLIFGAQCGGTLSTTDVQLEATRIFPNPAKDLLTIDTPANLIIKEVSLSDITGKRTKVSMTNNTIDIRDLSAGMYLLKIETAVGSKVHKVIKK